jgi:hypothetical protein
MEEGEGEGWKGISEWKIRRTTDRDEREGERGREEIGASGRNRGGEKKKDKWAVQIKLDKKRARKIKG